MSRLFTFLALVVLFSGCQTNAQNTVATPQGPYEANWESLRKYEYPEWFSDAKFGIFIHWGPYAVPAYGSEWYPRRMYEKDTVFNARGEVTKRTDAVYRHHLATYGDPSEFGYKDFIPQFKAEAFNAEEWLDLFEQSGARYIIPVAEHHDGFAMYNSKHTRWDAVEMGPKRDVLAELAEATRKRGLKFGASSHFAFNWNYYTKRPGWDTSDPEYADLYAPNHEMYAPCDSTFMAHWWDRTKDIIDSYEPDVLWFDFYIDRPEFAPYHPKLAAYYYNQGISWNKEVVLQTKNHLFESYPDGIVVADIERGKSATTRKHPWQTDTSVGSNSWGYVENWKSKTPTKIIHDLVDIVSKNGCLLLNVGPKADGTIPEDQAEVLLEIGRWLDQNGEAIFETRPWIKFGEGPTEVVEGRMAEFKAKSFTAQDIRFTRKGDTVYAIALGWPQGGPLHIESFGSKGENELPKIQSVSLVGYEGDLEWEQTETALVVHFPANPPGKHAFVLKVE